MQNKRKSTIKKLDLAKGIIIIEKIDKDQPNDFLCTKEFYQKSLSEEKLKVLNEGDEVTFKAINKGNKFYAQDIQVIKFKKLSLSGKSTIKRICLEKEQIIISQFDDYKKDFLCKKEYIKNQDDWGRFSVGDEVIFDYTIKGDNYFASNLEILTKNGNDWSDEKSKISLDNSVSNFVKQFTDQLKNTLENVTAPEDFEELVFCVLKMLGISEIYAIPRDNAGGRCDGIFKVSNISNNTPKLEVIYDCTLHRNWEQKKKEQINNYKYQICKSNMLIEYEFLDGRIKKPIKTSISLNDNSEKQIWIITKNSTRIVEDGQAEISGEQMSILVKEVNILDLISILESKLLDTKYIKIDDIADKLKHI